MINDGLQDDLITTKEEKKETLTESSSKEPTLNCDKPEFTEETHSVPKKATFTNMNLATPSRSHRETIKPSNLKATSSHHSCSAVASALANFKLASNAA